MATLSVGGTTVFDGATLQSGVALTSATFPSGHILQCKGDRHDFKLAGSAVVASGSSETPFGTSLEVAITCQSTSNFLVLHLHVPDFYTGSSSGGVHSGFVYDTNSFASSFTGMPGTAGTDVVGQYVSSAFFLYGSSGSDIFHLNIMSYVSVPSTAPIKIRPFIQVHNTDTYDMGGNYAAFSNQASLTAMEVQA